MPSYVIEGYRLNTTQMADVQAEIDRISRKIKTAANKTYIRLLGINAARICDMVALGQIKKEEGRGILEMADGLLSELRAGAEKNGIISEYNFRCFAAVFTHDNATYIQIQSMNPAYRSAFKSLENISLTEEEMSDPGNGKTKTWNDIMKEFKGSATLSVNLTPDIGLSGWDLKKLREKMKGNYPPVKERCSLQARYSAVNHYMSGFSNGGQISPAFLMMYMDMAVEQAVSEENRRPLKDKEFQLESILIDLNKDDSPIFPGQDDDNTAAAPGPEPGPEPSPDAQGGE